MSFWRRLFSKDRAPAAKRLSLKEQYQRKVQLYAGILTASNTALELMAQMQARRNEPQYFSPAYVQVNCAIVLDYTRRVVGLLKDFTGEDNLAAAGAFDRIAEQINTEIARMLEAGAVSPDLPFEGQVGRRGFAGQRHRLPGQGGGSRRRPEHQGGWGWWPAVQNGTVRARRYLVNEGRVTESTPPEPDPRSSG